MATFIRRLCRAEAMCLIPSTIVAFLVTGAWNYSDTMSMAREHFQEAQSLQDTAAILQEFDSVMGLCLPDSFLGFWGSMFLTSLWLIAGLAVLVAIVVVIRHYVKK